MALNRRGSRKLALDVLYEQEISGKNVDAIIERYKSNPGLPYAQQLVEGVNAHREFIDDTISVHAKDWKLDRMPVVDKNLLRIALFELQYLPDVPAPVAINEAVELAKIYSTEDSSRFVNGLLAAVLAGKIAGNVDNPSSTV